MEDIYSINDIGIKGLRFETPPLFAF